MLLFENLWLIWLESAPWLILGLLIAGVMKALIPSQWMEQQLGGGSRYSVIKAAFIGAPLPLCSCGVVPAALGIRRAGASKSVTVSFLVATPETGPDSITLSYALLGPFMAIIRPIAAISSAVVAGLLVRHEAAEQALDNSSSEKVTCCAVKAKANETKWQQAQSGLSYSFGKLLADISGWLIIGMLVAAIIQTYVPSDWFAQWGSGVSAMLVMAVVGIPMYICASASTPIAAGFLAAGLSPGAVLVFMLAGPATNIGTLGIIKKELGRAPLVAYLVGVIVTALAFGYATDLLAGWIQTNAPSWQAWLPQVITNDSHQHAMGDNWHQVLLSVGLILLMIRAKLK
ncbi:MAG: SO_0444 family Cu/Zn efflux transporter [Kangiellaceae bacterium]|jgi:uncharacterized membrane protein YraQ (UPF0718 family)|nr:SO_0444 family Cu/Zn efflux transporter [Kangiellaceae bacterium]